MIVPCPAPARPRRLPGTAAGVLCAALLACSSGGNGTPVDPEPPVTLPTGVHELAGIDESLPYTDLEPFHNIVGNTRFVALGESYHTSAGFYQAKGRLIRFMVEQMGFRAVMLETPWLEALPATEYVRSCTGTPESALASLNPVWRDINVREMLRWLCDYNRTHPTDPVTFFGFDIQEPWRTVPALRQFVQQAAPGEVARTEPLLRCLGATHANMKEFFLSQQYLDVVEGRRDAAAHAQCVGGIVDVESWIAANQAALQAASSAAAVEEARIALISTRAWEDQLYVPDPGGYQARDQGMAQTLLRLHALHTAGKKTVVWAWNWHIARRYEEVRGWNDDPAAVVPRQGARAMGGFLHDALGADYLPIALIGSRVQIRNGTSPAVTENPLAVERRLHQLGREYLLVDLRQPPGASLLPPGQTYLLSHEWGDPYRQFGALLFLEYSPPMG